MIGDKSGSEFAKENLKMGGKMKFEDKNRFYSILRMVCKMD